MRQLRKAVRRPLLAFVCALLVAAAACTQEAGNDFRDVQRAVDAPSAEASKSDDGAKESGQVLAAALLTESALFPNWLSARSEHTTAQAVFKAPWKIDRDCVLQLWEGQTIRAIVGMVRMKDLMASSHAEETLVLFNEGGAASWLMEASRMLQTSCDVYISVLANPNLGDEAFAFRFTSNPPYVQSEHFLVRTGDLLMWTTVGGTPGVERPDAARFVTEAQQRLTEVLLRPR